MGESRVIDEQVVSGDDAQIRAGLNAIVQTLKRKSRRPKKRILFLVDNHQWCWTTTARNIARNIPEYAFQIEPASEFRKYARQMLAMCDLVYLRGYPFAFFDGLDFIVDKPFIWTLSTGGENLEMRISQSIEYAARGAACVVQCDRARREAEVAGILNVHAIPNGVDLSLFKPAQAEKTADIGFAGNDEGARAHLKGVSFIREACERNGWTCRCVNKANRLSYTEMPSFYNSIRAYVQPSESEGCSNSVMEAMACGIPCLICEGVGYHGEQCQDAFDPQDCDNPANTSGNAIFVRRDPEDVAAKIKWLFANPDMYSRISSHAREFAERHDWKTVSARHRDMIAAVLEEARPPAENHHAECCGTCAFFTAMKKFNDCGICSAQCGSVYLRHRKMICEKHKSRKKETEA